MPEGEGQERPQRRRRPGAGEQPAHRAVPLQRHVLEAVRAGDHPRDQDTDQLRERADAQTEDLRGRLQELCERADAQTQDLRVRLQELRERADERAQEHRERVAELRARIAELTAAATVA